MFKSKNGLCRFALFEDLIRFLIADRVMAILWRSRSTTKRTFAGQSYMTTLLSVMRVTYRISVKSTLTHKAPPIICNGRQFQILPFFKK